MHVELLCPRCGLESKRPIEPIYRPPGIPLITVKTTEAGCTLTYYKCPCGEVLSAANSDQQTA